MSSTLDQTVFQRTTTDQETISAASYNFTIGLVLMWGFVVNLLIVYTVPASVILQLNFLVFMLLFFVSSLTGVFMFSGSDRPFISFIGYNLVVIPFGAVIDVAVARYDPSVALAALGITALVTLTMMCAGALLPQLFQKMAGPLLVALAGMIVIEGVGAWVFHVQYDAVAWIFAIIFSAYVAYDWGRANQIPKTVDNAVDSAAALYIDIVNLFLRILDILGRLKKGGKS